MVPMCQWRGLLVTAHGGSRDRESDEGGRTTIDMASKFPKSKRKKEKKKRIKTVKSGRR
jgi:hypothetical protein